MAHGNERLIEFQTLPTRTAAEYVRMLLLQDGIGAWLQTPGIGPGIWAAADFNPTTVMVLERQAEEARQALLRHRQDACAVDWEVEDLGAAEVETAARLNEISESQIIARRAAQARSPAWGRWLLCGWLLLGPFHLVIAVLIAAGLAMKRMARSTASEALR